MMHISDIIEDFRANVERFYLHECHDPKLMQGHV